MLAILKSVDKDKYSEGMTCEKYMNVMRRQSKA